MFTGIIDHCGIIKDIKQNPKGMTLWVETNFDDLIEGESIAINGICLTVVEPKAGGFRLDVSPETLRVTNLQHIKQDSKINLERALRANDRLGGHFVLGHVDGICTVEKITTHDEYTEMHFANIQKQQMSYLINKGSAAVNGVSLTVNEVFENSFSVMLIPHTLERTNLEDLKETDTVNIEFDYLARLVVDNHSSSLRGTK